MWTINYFQAYAMLSVWGIKGKFTCPHCMEDTKSFTLKHEGKSCWFDCHWQFLPRNQPFKKSQKRFLKSKAEFSDLPYLLNEDQLW